MEGPVQDGPIYWPGWFNVRMIDDRLMTMDEIRKLPEFSCDAEFILRFRQRARESLPAIDDSGVPIYPAFRAMRTFFPFLERMVFAMFGLLAHHILWNPNQVGLVIMCAFGDFRFYCDSFEAASVMSKERAWCHEIIHDLSALLQFEVSRYSKFWLMRMPVVRNDVLWTLCPEVTGLKARVQYLEEELKRRDELPLLSLPGSPVLLSPPSSPPLLDFDKIMPQMGV